MLHIIKNHKVYTSYDKNILKNLKNCYVIKNSGAPVNPCITYYKRENSKNTDLEFLGGIKELINFLLDNDENNIFVITGFSRAAIGSIYRNYLEVKMEQAREKIKNNEIQIRKLTKK